jgi:hypothetical protein
MARSRDINDRAIADFTQANRLDPKYAREKGIEQMLATLQKSQAQTPSQKTPAQSSAQQQPFIPAFAGLVVDTANLFTPADRARLEAKLKAHGIRPPMRSWSRQCPRSASFF